MDFRPSAPDRAQNPRCSVVGRGRLGAALARGLCDAGVDVSGPHGRGYDGRGDDLVLLCVPDAAIADAATAIERRDDGPLVGHCSGATTLAVLAPHERFSIHPLMTVTGAESRLAGAPCAVAGGSPRALAAAEALATALAMPSVRVSDEDRAAYHAAASIAANCLHAVEDLATRLAATAGVDRSLLGPLVRAAVDGWQADGAVAALTGPVARGDHATVARQRAAVAERLAPADLELFDLLTGATERLASRRSESPDAAPEPATTTIPIGLPA